MQALKDIAIRRPKTLALDKLSKVKGKLTKDTIEKMEAMGPSALNDQIATSVKSIEEAKEEMNENENYVKAKQITADFNGGLNDVKKRQNAIVAFARHLLAEKGV